MDWLKPNHWACVGALFICLGCGAKQSGPPAPTESSRGVDVAGEARVNDSGRRVKPSAVLNNTSHPPHPDGKTIVTASKDNTAKLWPAPSDENGSAPMGGLKIINWSPEPITILDESNRPIAGLTDEVGHTHGRSDIGAGQSKTYRLKTQTYALHALDLASGKTIASIKAAIEDTNDLVWDVGSVQKTAYGAYIVSTKAWATWGKDLNRVARQARVLPQNRAGKPAGFKLLGVRRDGVWYQLGLRSGDIVQTVNGIELNGIENGLKIVANLKTATQVTVVLERRRHTRTFTYRLR
ncbi:MAG: hypothetical protein CMH52_06545 [Myxococcales bacterium]|nr:hypothetical protein [Myxococcales bacterium]